MKDNLPFDDFAKAQFSNYSPDVPAHIWENIIAKRKSKPKGFWANILSGGNLLILSFVLLIGGGTTYLLLSSTNKSSSIKNNTTEKNIAADQTTQSINSSSEKNITENKPGTLSDQAKDLNGKNRSTEKNIFNKQTTDLTDQTQNVNDKNSSSEKNDIVSDRSLNFDRSNKNNSFKPSSSKTKMNTANANDDKNVDVENGDVSIIQRNKEVKNTILFSPFKLSNVRELSGTKILNSRNVKLPDCPTIEKNAAGNKVYWEVYAGPDHAYENYKSYGDTTSNNYLQKRKASTTFASAFSAGARYTKVFNNGTSVRTGINYTQVNEKFLYFNPNEIKNVTVITTRVVIRAPGDTIYISDTLQYQQTGTRIKTTYNRYRNIDIPLVIGYELGNGKIHANINAGVIINVYSWYKGDVLDTLYQPVTITTGKSNSAYQFKNNIGVGFLGSISVYYNINDKMHLLLEPYFRYNLSPMSKENLNLQQKYHIAGLHAGLRFDLK
jgi:hypothetical protein